MDKVNGDTNGPLKVAILGGGMGALAAAYELSGQSNVEVTVHTLGWRLGGKCASSRGPNDRIEEHGIHGFLGSYYNANPMLAQVYAELDRPAGSPIATFDEALVGMTAFQMYSYVNGSPSVFAFNFPENKAFPDPAEPVGIILVEDLVMRAIAFLQRRLAAEPSSAHEKVACTIVDQISDALDNSLQSDASALDKALLGALDIAYNNLRKLLLPLTQNDPKAYEIFTMVDWAITLIKGTLADDIANKGFDFLDDQNWSDWMAKHGAEEITVSSPMALNTINLAYQYPGGDTSKPSQMAAGAYVHWSLRSLAFCGQAIYAFGAGTGETVIAPFYEVLLKRGVKFEFFSKVSNLTLNADQSEIATVEIDLQATLKDGVTQYQPLMDPAPKGLPSWPAEPNYDQLIQGEAMQAAKPDLESWWTPWKPVAQRTLVAGQDFDHVVFALSVGAVKYVCKDLIKASPAWSDMVEHLPAVQTQAFQMWLSESMEDLGWNIPLSGNNTSLSDTYLPPLDGHCEMHHILKWESWPEDNTPKSLWYFCDEMKEDTEVPPFTDHDYPARMKAQVAATSLEYLGYAIGPLMPGATNKERGAGGPPNAFDFSLLVDTMGDGGSGPDRFKSQFCRANIDPTERYVQSPPCSTKYRMAPWETGFTNLAIAGDWVYNGLNVGSVEGAVMGGRLASFALTGSPTLDVIWGYPKGARQPK